MIICILTDGISLLTHFSAINTREIHEEAPRRYVAGKFRL